MPSTCSRCARFSDQHLDERDTLTAHGYGHCALLKPCQYQSRHAACALTPSRFQERAA